MNVVVLGGNGFIGHHLARRLKADGHLVTVVDIKECEYGSDHADNIVINDLRDPTAAYWAVNQKDEIYQLAADMGGCQYVFSGDHDADIMRNSAQINMNVLDAMVRQGSKARIFYSSSACMYPQEIQNDIKPNIRIGYSLKESDAYPANPDSDYGWEKLFSERLYAAYARNYGIDVRIARFHNIYGPEGTYKGGKEKAPASVSRKVIESTGTVEIWGDGEQTRSFLYINDCIDAVQLLMKSEQREPINIGSEEMVTINQLWDVAIQASGKSVTKKHVPMPPGLMGVRGRNSDNTLIRKVLAWEPKIGLSDGIKKTLNWIRDYERDL